MTGKIIDNGPPIAIVLILPIALVFAVLFVAWRVLLLLLAVFIAWKVWDNYQWQKLSQKVNPVFSQLLKENRGCLTPIDLSLKANLSGRVAKQFLERKSQEYGAQRQQIEDKGVAYLFLTASALGSIFDDSESDKESDREELESPITSQLTSTSPAVAPELPQSSVSEVAPVVELEKSIAIAEKEVEVEERSIASQHNSLQEEQQRSPTVSEEISVEKQQEEHLSAREYSSLEYIDSVGAAEEEHVQDNQDDRSLSLIQAELADRLGVNSSTVGRQKSKSDFPEWSQSRDPEGIAWKYISETKIFVSVDAEESS